ncbi:hypothetical protein [Legionella pneumophila]|uniref:Lipoprotein n=1 Tax=Legionella pneumophila subsp. pascullei TaxID=91890 RepID=A0AAX2IZG6_LEGPN|nr:hypothetical protein [Legionella pneumophila]AMP90882.1 hypothetical protein AXF35_14765 [Legionella pneumophila subsp. pascullei]AMP93867.1 hypothetical protein AXF36_15130 [Legionella pneumophila subsp. pascullei]AMP96784.1 hypothetical protein AXF37_14765 [Legionella pneumophila subsp. pascullei]SQG91840.1 Uncharacterised protein [Legionella pneumophila subsp. pascullei]VEH08386.1 Uncharacterised protein [Legionella pneumophila subsp. pascullei]
MINYNTTKWKYGLIVVFALGVSGCYFDGASPQERGYSSQENGMSSSGRQTSATNQSQPQQKSYASKDTSQKSTPGPKRTAAPQLPVIQ